MKPYHLPVAILIIFHISVASHAQSSVSVDPLTGRAQVTIPLHTVSVAGITIPLNLAHHGGAVKVQEPSGNCGLGWNLLVNWSVQRVVRGLPDDLNTSTRRGWLTYANALSVQNFTPSADDDLGTCPDEGNDWNFLEGRAYTNDTEPDLFYFQAPGISGEFVFDSFGNPRFLNLQDLAIDVTQNANQEITKFTIKTGSGLIYTFATAERVFRKSEKWKSVTPSYFLTDYNYYQDELNFISTWHLTTIRSAITGVTANFSYTQGFEANRADFKVKIEENNQVDTLYYIRDKVTPLQLSTIQLKSYTITINRSGYEIGSVLVSESASGENREFKFIYSQAWSSSDTYPIHYMTFLKEIRQESSCTPFSSYKFSYHNVNAGGINIPWNKGWGQDRFGYFNGATTNQNIPSAYFYSSETGANRLRSTPLPGVTATQVINGLDREPNSQYTGFGALEEIRYPGGGFSQIAYEPHTYVDASSQEVMEGPGVRVSSIASYGGDAAYGGSHTTTNPWRVIRKEYEYVQPGGSTTSGKLVATPAFTFAIGNSILRTQQNLGENPVVFYTHVKEKIPGQGSTLFEFSVPAVYPTVSENDWQVPSSKIARNPSYCVPLSNVKNGPYTYPYAPATNYDFERGLMSRQADYSETGTLVRERVLTYSRISKNPLVIKGLKFEKIGETYHYSVYTMLTGYSKTLTQEIIREASEENPSLMTQSTASYGYNANNMLETITKTNADNSINKEKIVYAKSFTYTNPGSADAIALKMLNDSSRYTEVVERITSYQPPGGTEAVTGAQLIRYRNFNGKVYPFKVYSFPTGATLTEATVGTGQTFVFDSTDYRLVINFEDYDSEGRVLNESNDKREQLAYHYALPTALLVASIAHAKSQHVLYEGFETLTSRGLNMSGNSNQARTGNKGRQLNGGGGINSAQTIEKGGNTYRFSCWVLASQAATLTVQALNGSTVQSTVSVNYSSNDINKWTYLETQMNMTSVSSVFSLKITTNVSVTLDDVIFLPATAKISTTTFQPLVGMTSVTDDQGRSSVVTYDDRGRKSAVLDTKRNLVERHEYKQAVQPEPTVNGNFSSSVNQFIAGQPVVFTAAENNCLTVTRQWKINGAVQGTAATLNYTFTAPGAYTIELSTSNVTYGTVTKAETICVELSFSPNLNVSGSTVFDCPDMSKTFSVTNTVTGCTIEYEWWVFHHSLGSWTKLTTQYEYNTATIIYGALNNYTMKVYVKVSCGGPLEKPCEGTLQVIREASVEMVYQPLGGPC
jgi:YD repeat-containing protein